ncbi:hypothetical protein POTOM_049284 [Populus tomentosa]|uniref:Uncharacterized protein n=1 Tax=Populus tomentosa TaxID=118781 RepID=A0A8X7Y632_POPTO|nr:hypothetical protein POTOM_049284 [Populus tomentosa]
MVHVSNTILAIFNCITLLIVGATISAISLFRLIGLCCRVNFALTLYLILLFLLLLCLVGFMAFAILVANESIGKSFSKTKIMDFHNWLRDNLGDEKHWNDIIKSFGIQTKI